jgi:hypothetical protein
MKKKPVIVVLYVEGGVVQGARSNVKGIDVMMFDVDNLKERMTRKKIDSAWGLWEKGCPHSIF